MAGLLSLDDSLLKKSNVASAADVAVFMVRNNTDRVSMQRQAIVNKLKGAVAVFCRNLDGALAGRPVSRLRREGLNRGSRALLCLTERVTWWRFVLA